MMYLNYLLELLVIKLFPRDLTCVICDRELFDLNKGNLCNICMGSLQFIVASTCSACGRQIPSTNSYGVCLNCSMLDRYYDTGIAVLKYDDYSKKAFFDLKYFSKKYIAHTMAAFIRSGLIKKNLTMDIDYFIPVPLHEDKLKKRGFNQAELICKHLNEQTDIETIDCIKRHKNTKALSGLDPKERQEVLSDVFSIKTGFDLKGKVVVIVDDIFTTGSTINECSKTLKQNGVAYIISACFGIGE